MATPTKKTGEAESRLQQLGNRLYGSSAANPGASTPAGRREAIGRRRLDLLGFLADYTGGTYHEAVDTTDVADAVGAIYSTISCEGAAAVPAGKGKADGKR